MYKYRHGGNVHAETERKNFLDLSASINPLGPPRQVEEAIRKEIGRINRYPDNFSTELCMRIAEFEGIRSEWIFCGSGSSEILFRLPRAVGAKTGMVLKPTFSDYARSLESEGCEIRVHHLREENEFICDENIFDLRVDILFFCNPNSPTGLLTERSFVEELLQCGKRHGTTIVIDECFMDFCSEAENASVKPLLESYDNLVLLKAFTKIFALPGIRLGYAICSNPNILDRLRFHGPDWPVSNLAQAAGVAVLENTDEYMNATTEFVSEERMRIKGELESFGYRVFDSRANFLLVKNPYEFNMKNELDEKSIRIRTFENADGLGPNYFRIGLSTYENNLRFLGAVKEITSTKGVPR